MRGLVAMLLFLAACGDDAPDGAAPTDAPPAELPRVVSVLLPKEIERINLDGNASDAGWAKATEVVIPLRGNGPAQVAVQSVHNDRYVYFLLKWKDENIDRGNVVRYEDPGRWKLHEGEDAFLMFFPPPELSGPFRRDGFATFVKDGEFHYPGETGFADAWYWGAQTTRPHLQARDHWLQPKQHLRGDSQPENSDNILNWSAEFDGPVGVPQRVRPESTWYLPVSNSQQLNEMKMARLNQERTIGWTVPAILSRKMAGSRADVWVSSRHVGGVWIAEVARELDTGHRDDHPLGVSSLFAIAVYDGTGKGARVGEYGVDAAVSTAVEIDFLSAP